MTTSQILTVEREIIADAEVLLKKNPSAAELASFQKAAADKALTALKRAGRRAGES